MAQPSIPLKEINISLKLFEILDDNQIKQLSEALNVAKFPIELRSKSKLFDLIQKTTGVSENEPINYFFGVILAALFSADDYEDFIGLFNSIITHCDEDSSSKKKALDFINSITLMKEFYEYQRLESYKTRGVDFFRSFSYACDLRGRFKVDFDYDSNPVEKYKPEILDVVPIILLKFLLGPKENSKVFSFQAEVDELDFLISSLLAAQKELKLLKQRFINGVKDE